MADVKNLKEALLFFIELSEGVIKAGEDKDYSWRDFVHFIPAVKALPAALADFDEIPGEFTDMDDAEKDEVTAYVKEEFDIPDDEIELFVEEAFAVVLTFLHLILVGKEILGKKD